MRQGDRAVSYALVLLLALSPEATDSGQAVAAPAMESADAAAGDPPADDEADDEADDGVGVEAAAPAPVQPAAHEAGAIRPPAGPSFPTGAEAFEDEPNPKPTARVQHGGEWYVPGPVDLRLAESGRDAWHGPYRGLEVRYVLHSFFNSPISGLGSELLVRLDLSDDFGIQVGGYFPGGGLDVGINLFGNHRVRLFSFRGADASVGLMFPEITLRGVVLQDPKTLALSVGANLLGIRIEFADLVQLSIRGGAPNLWFTIPELGVAFSWSVGFDAGIQF
jgi:hypothetical protein